MVPKLELERLGAKGLPQHLVPHADPEHRLLSQDLLGILHGIGHRGWVALRAGVGGEVGVGVGGGGGGVSER